MQTKQFMRRRGWLAGLAAAAVVLAPPTLASAAPIQEVEPNDTPLTANGPVPADGWVSTRNTTNDDDYAWLNVAATSQVTISVTVQECTNAGSVAVLVTATDALGRSHLSQGVGAGRSYSWTTPDLPVRLQLRAASGPNGCTLLTKVAPSAAILVGALPEPPARTVSIGLPVPPTHTTSPAEITFAGSSYVGDSLGYQVIPASAPCTSTPAAANASVTWLPALLTGTYSLPATLTLPEAAGNYLVCAWLHNSDSRLQPVPASAGLVVTDPPPPPRPKATITTLRLKRGAKFEARVEHVTGKVMVTFSQGGKRRKTAHVTVRGNRVTVTTKRLRRGTYRVGVWLSDRRLAADTVIVR